jgi:exoribonuclease R
MPDIYVAGVRDRNRALNGDEVLVDLHPSKDWKVLGERIRDYLEAKEDAKEQLTAEDLALKMAALKFNSDKDAEAEPEKARNG